jgi:hypothetical protein
VNRLPQRHLEHSGQMRSPGLLRQKEVMR